MICDSNLKKNLKKEEKLIKNYVPEWKQNTTQDSYKSLDEKEVDFTSEDKKKQW